MASKLRALATEARWRGFWGTVRAIKLNKLGTMHCFVGEDHFKNRYFEDKSEWFGRDRWVEYVDDLNPDSLKITPEWHAWLHHNIDTPPTEAPLPAPAYVRPSAGNPTGTANAYLPPHHRLNKHFDGAASDKFETWTPPGQSSPAGAQQQQQTPEKDVLDLK